MKRSWTVLLLAAGALPAAALADPQYSAEEIIEHFTAPEKGAGQAKPGVRGVVIGEPGAPRQRGVFIGAAGFGNEASAAAAASPGASAAAEENDGAAAESAAGTEPALAIPMTGAQSGQAAPAQDGTLAAAAQPQAVVTDPGSYDLLITFELDSANLSRQARENLDAFVAALRSRSLAPYRFTVEGHTDATGTEEYNQRLSERRAASVVDYLVSKGVEASRLVARGYGETRPRMGDPGHPENRRVETRRLE